MALPEDPKAKLRVNAFSRLCSRHPLCVQAGVFLMEDPYLPGDTKRNPYNFCNGPEAVEQLGFVLDRYWVYTSSSSGQQQQGADGGKPDGSPGGGGNTGNTGGAGGGSGGGEATGATGDGAGGDSGAQTSGALVTGLPGEENLNKNSDNYKAMQAGVDLDTYRKSFQYNISKDCRTSVELFRKHAMKVTKLEHYMPIIYKCETRARNAFLAYDKQDTSKILHMRWWLFIAVQRMIVDRFSLRRDGSISVAKDNFMRLDSEQIHDDQEVSYFRQVVRRCLDELANDWRWKNIVNGMIHRSIRLFAEGKFQLPSNMKYVANHNASIDSQTGLVKKKKNKNFIHIKQQIDAICQLELLVKLLMDDLLLPLQLTVTPITHAQYIFEKSFVIDKDALEKTKIRQGAPPSNKAKFGAFVSLIVKREKKEDKATGKKGGLAAMQGGNKSSTQSHGTGGLTLPLGMNKDGQKKVEFENLEELEDEDHSQSPLNRRHNVSKADRMAKDLERKYFGVNNEKMKHLSENDIRLRKGALKPRMVSPTRRIELRQEEAERQKAEFKNNAGGGAAKLNVVQVNEKYGTLEIKDRPELLLPDALVSVSDSDKQLDELCKYFAKLSKLTQLARYDVRDVLELQKIPFPRFEYREFREFKRIDVELYNMTENALLQSGYNIFTEPVPCNLKSWVDSEIVNVKCPHWEDEDARSDDKTAEDDYELQNPNIKDFCWLPINGKTLDLDVPGDFDAKHLATFYETDYIHSIPHRCPKYSLFFYDEPRPKKYVKIDGKLYEVNEETGQILDNYLPKEERARIDKTRQDYNKKILDLKDKEMFDLDRDETYDGPPTEEMLALLAEMNNALQPHIYRWDFKNEVVQEELPVVKTVEKKESQEEERIEARGEKINPGELEDSDQDAGSNAQSEKEKLESELQQLNEILNEGPRYETEEEKFAYNQVKEGYWNLQLSLHFNTKIQESQLILTAFPFCVRFHPLNFVYGSSFFLTAALFANFGTRLRYLGLNYCADVDTNILRVILLKCPNLMVLDVTGIVREGHKRLKEIRENGMKYELETQTDNSRPGTANQPQSTPPQPSSFEEETEEDRKLKHARKAYATVAEHVAKKKMNGLLNREQGEYDRFHDLLPGIPVDALCQLVEQHKYLKVLIANESRLEPDSVLRLLYSCTVMNSHSLAQLQFANAYDCIKAPEIHDPDTWDTIITQLDDYVLKRGERCVDRGEFIAYEQGISWRKQPKPHTTSSLTREGYGEKAPVPVSIEDMQKHVHSISQDLMAQRDKAVDARSKITLDEIHQKMQRVHQLLLHPQIRLYEDFADAPEEELDDAALLAAAEAAAAG